MEYLDRWMSGWRVSLLANHCRFQSMQRSALLFLKHQISRTATHTHIRSLSRSPEDVVKRLDALIAEIREKHQRKSLEDPESSKGDVLVVAHGHILRAFAMRWTGKPLNETSLILEAGGVGTLR